MDWSNTPPIDSTDWHARFGGQEWRYTSAGVFLRSAPNTPLRSDGEPRTCRTILSLYGDDIHRASVSHGVPPELIVMTIATETAFARDDNFTGPRTFRWEAGVEVRDVSPPTMGDYSAGPMQTLATAARDVIRRLHLPHDAFAVAPHFATRPAPAPASHPLYDARLNIDIGTAEIKSRLALTGFDPILVAAAYNSGGLRETSSNVWRLRSHGDHLDRASKWFGDACFLLAALRQGAQPESIRVGPADARPTGSSAMPVTLLIEHIPPEDFEEQFNDYVDSDADVEIIPEGGGLNTLRVTYAHADGPGLIPTDPLPAGLSQPDRDGYVICVDRLRVDTRNGKRRTVGVYQAYFNRVAIPNISGWVAERPGPGDNSATGRMAKARIKAGTYPLFTHLGGGRYRTFGHLDPCPLPQTPRPCIGVGDTGARAGILIHCAKGFLWSEGCLNLSASLPNARADIDYQDSISRVLGLIADMKGKLGNRFPTINNRRIEGGWLIITGEPM